MTRALILAALVLAGCQSPQSAIPGLTIQALHPGASLQLIGTDHGCNVYLMSTFKQGGGRSIRMLTICPQEVSR